MIIFYRLLSFSPSIQKVSMMLNETGFPYKEKNIEWQSDGLPSGNFLTINPNGTVPAIVDEDNGAVIFESGAILCYLAEKSGKLLPTDVKNRGEVMTWLMFEAANMGPIMVELFHYMLKASDDIADVHLRRYKNKLAQCCAILDRQLYGRAYLCGEYSIADIALFPWCGVLEDIADVKLNDYPSMNNWADRIARRPAATAS